MPANPSFLVSSDGILAAIFMASMPRTAYQSTQQETDSNGVLKWTCQVACSFSGASDDMPATSLVIDCTIVSPSDPGQSLNMGTPVIFDHLRVGIGAPEVGQNGRVRGGKPFYGARSIRPASAQALRPVDSKAS